MKYWTKKRHGKISLNDNEGLRTLAIKMMYKGTVLFREECDGYFGAEMSREEAVSALREAIEYIENYEKTI